MNGNVEVDSDGSGDEIVEKSPLHIKKTIEAIGYLTSNAKVAFIQLKKGFTKASIFHHFDPECHIRIRTDTSGYAIGKVFS